MENGGHMKVIIDRIEGDTAVIFFDIQKVYVPLSDLPKGSEEGSWLKVSFKLDPNGEQKQKDKMDRLIGKVKNKEMG
jgi:hypothetical protein